MMIVDKLTLLTVIAVPELEERLVRDLTALGVRGYTESRVQGRGAHGHRLAGLVDAPNLKLEMFVAPAVAGKVLQRIATKYADLPILAYAHDVETPTGHLE